MRYEALDEGAGLESTRASEHVAGQHARARTRELKWRALTGLGVLCLFTVLAGVAFGFTSMRFVAAEAIAIVLMLLLDRFGTPVVERWGQGARGEEAVGDVLAPLRSEGWFVLHDVVLGSRGNIDHIAIGPGGLFTIETKSHKGRIRAADVDRRMLAQSYAQAKAVERVTGENAVPLLVFSSAFLQPMVSRQRGVLVLPARALPGHLRRRRPVLTAEKAAALHKHLCVALDGGYPVANTSGRVSRETPTE